MMTRFLIYGYTLTRSGPPVPQRGNGVTKEGAGVSALSKAMINLNMEVLRVGINIIHPACAGLFYGNCNSWPDDRECRGSCGRCASVYSNRSRSREKYDRTRRPVPQRSSARARTPPRRCGTSPSPVPECAPRAPWIRKDGFRGKGSEYETARRRCDVP